MNYNQQFILDIKQLCQNKQFTRAFSYIDTNKQAEKINFALYEQASLYVSAMSSLHKVRLSPDSDLWFNEKSY